MADHKPVIGIVVLLHRFHHQLPVLRCYIGTVDVAHLNRLHLTYMFHLRNAGQNVIRRQARGQSVFRLL